MNSLSRISGDEDYQADVYPESRFSVRDLSGMGGILDSLFGKPQSWYDRVNALQNQLAVLQAGISAIGPELWDTIFSQYQEQGGSNSVGHFDSYDATMSRLASDMAAILVTSKYVPSDEALNSANIAIAWWNPELSYARSVMPELEAKVQADMAESQAMVSAASLKSPATVGVETFEKEVEDRAKALGQGASDLLKYATWALGAIAAIVVASKFGGGRRAA